MGFRLKLREPLSGGLKRVFREQIQSALELCRHPAKQRGVTVHEVRKHLKKLRAAMRLAIDEIGKNRHAREDRCAREIGGLVSDLRDAQVRLQTLIQLRDETAKGSGENHFPRIEELLSLERESFSAAFAGWQKQAIPKLERVGKRLSKWPLAGITWKQVCGTVGKTYKLGQRGLAKTIKKAQPENFHALGELLGREHDFNFLLARLENERGDEALHDELVQLQKLIRKRGKRLRRDALELGRRFYAEPSKAFAKRISIFIGKRKV